MKILENRTPLLLNSLKLYFRSFVIIAQKIIYLKNFPKNDNFISTVFQFMAQMKPFSFFKLWVKNFRQVVC